MPKPRKLNDDSKRIVVAILNAEITIKDGMTFGKICLIIMTRSFVPIDLAALTKSLSFTLKTSPLTILAYVTQFVIPITMISPIILGLKTANKTKTNKILGIDKNESTILIKILSITPPK